MEFAREMTAASSLPALGAKFRVSVAPVDTSCAPGALPTPPGFKHDGTCVVTKLVNGARVREYNFIKLKIEGKNASVLISEHEWSTSYRDKCQNLPLIPKVTSSRPVEHSSRYVKYLSGYFGPTDWLSPCSQGKAGLKSVIESQTVPEIPELNEHMEMYNAISEHFKNKKANGFELKAYIGNMRICYHIDGGCNSQVEEQSAIGAFHFTPVPKARKEVSIKTDKGVLTFVTKSGAWMLVGPDAQIIYHSIKILGVSLENSKHISHYTMVFRTQSKLGKYLMHSSACQRSREEKKLLNEFRNGSTKDRTYEELKTRRQNGPQLYYDPNVLLHRLNKHMIISGPMSSTRRVEFKEGQRFVNDRNALVAMGFLVNHMSMFHGPSSSGSMLSIILSKPGHRGSSYSLFDGINTTIVIEGQQRNFGRAGDDLWANKWMKNSLRTQERINFFIVQKILNPQSKDNSLVLQYFYLHKYGMAKNKHWYYVFKKTPLTAKKVCTRPYYQCPCCQGVQPEINAPPKDLVDRPKPQRKKRKASGQKFKTSFFYGIPAPQEQCQLKKRRKTIPIQNEIAELQWPCMRYVSSITSSPAGDILPSFKYIESFVTDFNIEAARNPHNTRFRHSMPKEGEARMLLRKVYGSIVI
mmetsp:Transcript_3689/g.4092  ORF Transcript_3689/g.4092 Transcript_3689/m.4092 type:complete len:638 (+) Transcript_3689:76-1989(+)